jgi:enoyl-[acyl-carrier-protein] reductase (NADH)
MYRLMGLAHAQLHRTYRHMAVERGQGTVEYVALILLVAGVFAAVVAAGGKDTGKSVRDKITTQITKQIDNVGNTKPDN